MKKGSLFSNVKLISDENIPVKVTSLLKKEGFDIRRAPLKISDKQLAKQAKEESRIILTLDKDFLNKSKFYPEDFEGIIFIDIQPPIIEEVFSSLIKLFNKISSQDCKGKLLIASKFGYRFKN